MNGEYPPACPIDADVHQSGEAIPATAALRASAGAFSVKWSCVPRLHQVASSPIGLALSGGAVRGIAHIGVIKVLAEAGIQPAFIAGASAGSLVGAGLAAGMGWRDIEKMAREVFWPGLLVGRRLEQFCARLLPPTFADLAIPFAAVATALPHKRPITLTEGPLASAISASCAMRVIRRPVDRNGHRLKDGGISCVLPSVACRELGAGFVIGSDVWEISALLRGMGFAHDETRGQRVFPDHYLKAARHTDVMIHPRIPWQGYWPGEAAVERLIASGEVAARRALAELVDRAA
jgi:NTE family protein